MAPCAGKSQATADLTMANIIDALFLYRVTPDVLTLTDGRFYFYADAIINYDAAVYYRFTIKITLFTLR